MLPIRGHTAAVVGVAGKAKSLTETCAEKRRTLPHSTRLRSRGRGTKMGIREDRDSGASVAPKMRAGEPQPARSAAMPTEMPDHATQNAGHDFPPVRSQATPAHNEHFGHRRRTSHNISDSAMAASMEARCRNPFRVSFALAPSLFTP